MGLIQLFKKGFGKNKRYYLEVPKEFTNHCDKQGKDVICTEAHNEHFVILGSSDERNAEYREEITSLLGVPVTNNEITIKLVKAKYDVTYNEVCGFFMFRGVLYYRAHGAAGKYIGNLDTSFTEHIQGLYPEYSEICSKEVSALMVTPMIVQ